MDLTLPMPSSSEGPNIGDWEIMLLIPPGLEKSYDPLFTTVHGYLPQTLVVDPSSR